MVSYVGVNELVVYNKVEYIIFQRSAPMPPMVFGLSGQCGLVDFFWRRNMHPLLWYFGMNYQEWECVQFFN